MIVLDAKTDYSFLKGYGTAEQWLARCKEIGVTHLGIADYCSTWGHTFFRKTFKGHVKLLYGAELPVVSRLDKDKRFSLVSVYARDDLAKLYELVTLAHKQSYYRPRVTWEQLAAFNGWVIVKDLLPLHVNHVTEDMFVARGPHDKIDTHTIPIYTPCYPSANDRQGFKLFQAIASGKGVAEVEYNGIHMLSAPEFKAMYDMSVGEGDRLASMARSSADIPQGTLIDSGVQGDKSAALKKLALSGAKTLGLKMTKPYKERLERELSVIHEKNFEDYFFFVADIVGWSKQRMFVGPGRGSAGGSLLCYLLGITTVDPLKFNTMFERFIDITRPDLPDIDVDFPDSRREEVFDYLKEKYGADRVARLGTISEFGGKSAINDTAKATGVPFDVAREFGKYTEGVGQGVVISPARVFGVGAYEGQGLLSEEHAKLLDKWGSLRMAAQIDGHARHHGVHAAGIVVTQGPVSDFGSLTKEGVLAMDMRAAETIGLVKMDALGLRTLRVIQTACDLAGIEPKTLYDLDWEDQAIYDAIFNKDRVTGIFQFEGTAVRGLMKGIKVERFDDICALTSLARPGPLIGGAAAHWVSCRRGDEEARELHPSLESTYGVICYQEQMMHIMRDIGGFDEPSVNGARRAVGKKDVDKLKSYRDQFVAGAQAYFTLDHIKLAGGTHPDLYAASEEKANALWDELEEFGSYAFNLAHAVEYAMISFQTAWLKKNYPLPFAVACLRAAVDDEQGKNLLRELKEEGFEYVPFDAEKSKSTWAVIDGKLYGGFDSVRGIGEKTAQNFVAKRNNDPEHWLEHLTESQRTKLLAPQNTPWHELTHFSDHWQAIYDDPDHFKSVGIPSGVKGPVLHIRDIPEKKDNYAFIGRINRVTKRDMNDESRLAKRNGKVLDKNNFFINIDVEDDTGTISGTINRFDAPDFTWLLEEDMAGRDFLFRGDIINDGRPWIFFKRIVELKK